MREWALGRLGREPEVSMGSLVEVFAEVKN